MKNAIQQLININPPDKNNSIFTPLELEIYYKIACYLVEVNEIEGAEKYFSHLINYKYYRAFIDFALFLYEKKNETQKALVILRFAIDNGYNSANIIYYNIFLNSFDLSRINKED